MRLVNHVLAGAHHCLKPFAHQYVVNSTLHAKDWLRGHSLLLISSTICKIELVWSSVWGVLFLLLTGWVRGIWPVVVHLTDRLFPLWKIGSFDRDRGLTTFNYFELLLVGIDIDLVVIVWIGFALLHSVLYQIGFHALNEVVFVSCLDYGVTPFDFLHIFLQNF